MPGETEDARAAWKFTDEDKARLQPLLNKMLLRANAGVPVICKIACTVEGRIQILQGFCEALGERLKEEILEQIDRGEWAARGINDRADISITVSVDAAGAMLNDANLVHLSMLPTEHLS